ncbi:hypothetical protein AK830_g691 [Neonectria ditissima]|uniref:Uncharacterized protein n=1 Tax=Neonectria ditissima TaxID=78410 RepID=A0A0P7BGJ8_9HYPO|nr:hypothetical protein AK830_g691 [Neonectria ditissima]
MSSNNYNFGTGSDSYVPLPDADMTAEYDHIANTVAVQKAVETILKSLPESDIRVSRAWTIIMSSAEVILWAATENGRIVTLSPPHGPLRAGLRSLHQQLGTEQAAVVDIIDSTQVLFWWRLPDVDDHHPMTAPADEIDPSKKNWVKIKGN